MGENASKNVYILRALEKLQNNSYPIFLNKLEQEGSVVLPNVITLAFVLEKITSTMSQNWRFLKVSYSFTLSVTFLCYKSNVTHFFQNNKLKL